MKPSVLTIVIKCCIGDRVVHTKWWSYMMVMVMVVVKRDDQVLQLGKEEREKQKPSVDQDKGIK